MILVERTKLAAAALPVAQLRQHLRMGSGFADDGLENDLLETILRSAIAAVEAWTGKVLVARDYTWTLMKWRETRAQPLPVAPITEITAMRLVTSDGAATVADPGLYRLQRDTHRPLVTATGPCLPGMPDLGSVEIDFSAGFGVAWDDVPPDLAQAVLLLAAHYHEFRLDLRGGAKSMPYGVSVLTEPWRNMRLFGGRGSR